MNDETFNIDAEGRAIDKALRSILAKAKAAGVKDPELFFESEGGLHLIEGDGYDGTEDAAGRQRFIRATAYIRTRHDVGAW